jgi:hypothetical protein
MTHRSRARALRAGLITTTLAATLLTVTTTAAGAADQKVGPYGPRVVAARDTCDARGEGRTYDRMKACVGDLAAPDPQVPFQMDLWNTFLDCLSIYYRKLDEMYPGGGDVNECLERHGYDVGPP